MTEKKRREKVNAEITSAHLIQFAREAGIVITQEEAVTFLNGQGRAYAMWKHMMQAGEEYIKNTLQRESRSPIAMRPTDSRRNRLVV
jgi:hypothetical protein